MSLLLLLSGVEVERPLLGRLRGGGHAGLGLLLEAGLLLRQLVAEGEDLGHGGAGSITTADEGADS